MAQINDLCLQTAATRRREKTMRWCTEFVIVVSFAITVESLHSWSVLIRSGPKGLRHRAPDMMLSHKRRGHGRPCIALPFSMFSCNDVVKTPTVRSGSGCKQHGFILAPRVLPFVSLYSRWYRRLTGRPFTLLFQEEIGVIDGAEEECKGTEPHDADEDEFLGTVEVTKLRELCEQYNLSTAGSKNNLLSRLRSYAAEQASRSRDSLFYYCSAESGHEMSHPDAKAKTGQKVVTVYSTTDQNDMTGFGAHAKAPVQGLRSFASNLEGGKAGHAERFSVAGHSSKTKGSSQTNIDAAHAVCIELIGQLLSETGFLGFKEDFCLGLTRLASEGKGATAYANHDAAHANISMPIDNSSSRRGFDVNSVSKDFLTRCSKSLRAGNGQALLQAIRDFEIQAVGHDGMAGDDELKGGGHYKVVQEVYAFLEGFRQAEVRRISRSTISMLLRSIVEEGEQGLDRMFTTMERGEEEGQLGDSLIDFLSDAIRSQEKKVQRDLAQEHDDSDFAANTNGVNASGEDMKTATMELGEDGVVIETLDLNDLEAQGAISSHIMEVDHPLYSVFSHKHRNEMKGSEQLLLLLQLLQERIKTEAALQGDDRVKDLRLLAYCLRTRNHAERAKILLAEIGASLNRMDTFAQLLRSALDYAESTSHKMMPSRKQPLDIELLKTIRSEVIEMRRRQAILASSSTYRPHRLL